MIVYYNDGTKVKIVDTETTKIGMIGTRINEGNRIFIPFTSIKFSILEGDKNER